jgi:hypothetical protein
LFNFHKMEGRMINIGTCKYVWDETIDEDSSYVSIFVLVQNIEYVHTPKH